jgi:hypothetical protein
LYRLSRPDLCRRQHLSVPLPIVLVIRFGLLPALVATLALPSLGKLG